MIRPYLGTIINDHKTHKEWRVHSGNTLIDYKTQGEWKIQLSVRINFMSSKDFDEICTMDTTSNNIEIMIGNKTDEIVKKLSNSLLQKYQEGLEESMRGKEFVFDSVHLLYYKLQNISLNRGGLYTDSPKWLKNKKATINPKNKDDKCFQYAVVIALNHKEIKVIQKEYNNKAFY